jgi:CRISPR system Cascade subunit CasD
MTAAAPFPQLCWTLMAPYGSWGAASLSSATTAWKATELDPPKSAIVGLLGAALGLPRNRLGDLSDAIRIAVRTGLRPRHDPRPDYHTISRARRPEGRDRWSRFEELRSSLNGRDSSGALLSRREYWSYGLWSVAVTAIRPDFTLQCMAGALTAPRWVLYAGRKSCMLGLPPDPRIEERPGPVAALAAYGWPWERRPALAETLKHLRKLMEGTEQRGQLAFDPDYPGIPVGNEAAIRREIRRRDHPDPLPLPGGRIYQRFHEREEIRMAWPDDAMPPCA